MVRSSLTTTRPALSTGTPSVLPSGDAALPAAQTTVRAGRNCPPFTSTPSGVTFVTVSPSWTSTPICSSCFLPLTESSGANPPKMRGPPSMMMILALAELMQRKVARHRVPGDLADGTRHLDPGRAAADDHERHRRVALGLIDSFFGDFESGQHSLPDFDGVGEVLQAGGEFLPLVVPEIAVPRAGGQDQEIVGNHQILGDDLAGGGVHASAPRRE